MTNELATSLADLAARINVEHAAVEATLRAGLDHARNAGNLLLQAKEQCPHGRWIPWLETNVSCTVRAVQGYMRVAREWDRLAANTQRVSHLSYREALRLLAEPTSDQAELPAPEASQDAREQARQVLALLAPSERLELLREAEAEDAVEDDADGEREIPLDAIRIFAPTLARNKLDQGVVDAYAERTRAGSEPPPVDVFQDGADYWLADGLHRYHAVRKLKRRTILATVRKGTERDATLFACGANADDENRTLVPMTMDDLRFNVSRALQLRPAMASEKIAEHCGVSVGLVEEMRLATV